MPNTHVRPSTRTTERRRATRWQTVAMLLLRVLAEHHDVLVPQHWAPDATPQGHATTEA